MPRKKRTSRILERVELRATGLKAINPNLDFGDTQNLTNLTQLIKQLRTKIDAYNTALFVIDSYKTQIEELEKSLSTLSETMLMGVALKYGKDSLEYEMAGGVRSSERARRMRASRWKTTSKEVSQENTQSV